MFLPRFVLDLHVGIWWRILGFLLENVLCYSIKTNIQFCIVLHWTDRLYSEKSVFTTLMISAHMLSNLTDSVDEEESLKRFNHLELTTCPCLQNRAF